MKYLTTTEPPAAIRDDYGLRIDWAPPVFCEANDDPAKAGQATAAAARDRIRQGHPAITLRDVFNDRVRPVKDNTDWWETFCEAFTRWLSIDADQIEAVCIDHARFGGARRQPEWMDWMRVHLTLPLLNLSERVRVGMFGMPYDSPTVWTRPADYADAVTDKYGARPRPDDYDERAIAWTIMPGQHRDGPPPTAAEFTAILDMLQSQGIDTVCVWSDPRKDAMGRPKTSPADWHDFLTAAAIVAGRRVTVPTWEPPAWLPAVAADHRRDHPRASGIFAGGEEVQRD